MLATQTIGSGDLETHLIRKPHVLRAFWSIFILFCIVIPVFEEKYQPINRHASETLEGVTR
jgi:hypothetical protein